MLNANFIIYDKHFVIIAYVSAAIVDVKDCISKEVLKPLPPNWSSGQYIWDSETKDYIYNPEYDEQTALGKLYWANVGWVDSDYNPNENTIGN